MSWMSSMEPVLSVRDLQVGYGSYVLMRNVTFDVAAKAISFSLWAVPAAVKARFCMCSWA